MFIDGFGLSEYRSYGRDIQRIGPFEKINFFIGQNNSGKSNVLLFLKNHYGEALRCEDLKLSKVDRHIGQTSGKQVRQLGLKIGGGNYNILLSSWKERLKGKEYVLGFIERIFMSTSLKQGTDLAWFCYEGKGKNALSPKLFDDIRTERILNDSEWSTLWKCLTGRGGGGIKQHWIPETLRLLSPVNLAPPKVDLVPAFREVKKGGIEEDNLSGIGLIDRLMQLQNPAIEKPEDRRRFDEINKFLQTVVGNTEATIQIPHDMTMIIVEMNNKKLPLSSLGTGIHEVVIMAAAATVVQNQVLCIEEPEIHLHPFLQKQLVRYLNDKTSNQYFISTHSAHLLDTPDSRIFHVRNDGEQSMITPAFTEMHKSRICDDLGYRASDLLQANCVIWVEGPTDRIYLNHWIHAVASELVERFHYSIMFYGGRLLSHLTSDDQEISDFISLRHLNRHIAIVIDSDRSDPKDSINDTKKRIQSEFDNEPGFSWVTEGREIENYVEPGILDKAVKELCREATTIDSNGAYDNCLEYKNKKGELCRVDKVKVANSVTSVPANLDVLDLKIMVEKVVEFIREANDLLK